MDQKLRTSPAATGEARKHRLGSLNSSKGNAAPCALQAQRRRFLERRGVPEPLAGAVAVLAFEVGLPR